MTETFRVSKRIPMDADEEYKKYALESVRREVGNKLYDILWKNKLPCVVDVNEEIIAGHNVKFMDGLWRNILEYDTDDEIRISVNLTNVQHRNIVMPSFYPVWDYKSKQSKFSKFIRRIFNARK